MDSLPRPTSLVQEKYCPSCKTSKPLGEFAKDAYRSAGYSVYCKRCKCEHAKTHHNHAKLREYRLVSRFNLTQLEYDQMYLVQGGVCAICKRPETGMDNTGKKTRALAVDHDHETGKVRQLLCGACNYLIGCAKEDADLLQSASDYLRKHKSEEGK